MKWEVLQDMLEGKKRKKGRENHELQVPYSTMVKALELD